jgi:hypothetical protein
MSAFPSHHHANSVANSVIVACLPFVGPGRRGSLDIYHAWCDLKPGVSDVGFAEKVADYMCHLKEQGLIES